MDARDGIGLLMHDSVHAPVTPSRSVCRKGTDDDPFDDSGMVVESRQVSMARADQVREQLHERFEPQQRHGQWQRRQLVDEQADEAMEVSQFGEQLEQWVDGWGLWDLQGQTEQQHGLEDCRDAEIEVVLEAVSTMTREMQRRKRVGTFSSCYICGVGQATCQGWK